MKFACKVLDDEKQVKVYSEILVDDITEDQEIFIMERLEGLVKDVANLKGLKIERPTQ